MIITQVYRYLLSPFVHQLVHLNDKRDRVEVCYSKIQVDPLYLYIQAPEDNSQNLLHQPVTVTVILRDFRASEQFGSSSPCEQRMRPSIT